MAAKITLGGKTYTRSNGQWIDPNYMVVHEVLQDRLNNLYRETIDLSTFDLRDIISEGDAFKRSASYGIAIEFYEYAIEQADRPTISYLFPRLTSCYRKLGRAKDVIKLASKIKSIYGSEMFSTVLLTSTAAAYCDLEEYDNARKCCNRAYAKSGGKASEELSLVYKRIKAETK